jgi:chemotaxis signal transduction protein
VAAQALKNLSAPLATSPAPDSMLVLAGRVGKLGIALPVAAVERVLPMAMITPVPEMPPHVVGVLNMHGVSLLVVNPRPLLGLPTPRHLPDQRLVIVNAGTRFVLWVDTVERIVHTPFHQAPQGVAASERALAPYIANLEGETTLVLSPEALDPGTDSAHVDDEGPA